MPVAGQQTDKQVAYDILPQSLYTCIRTLLTTHAHTHTHTRTHTHTHTHSCTHVGIGHYENVSKPTQVSLNTDEEVSSLYTYADTSFALTGENCMLFTFLTLTPGNVFHPPASGKAYGWGNNEYGQLASQTTEKQV